MANCGCTTAGALFSSAPAAIMRQDSSSSTVSRLGSTTAPCGCCAIAASSFAVAGIEPVEPAAITGSLLPARRFISASIRRSRRAAASIAPLFLETLWPIVARDLEEIERELPIFVELVRYQGVEPLPVHLARDGVVNQPGKIIGERERGGRRVGDQRCASFRPDRVGPAYDQLRQQKPPVELSDRGRQHQRVFRQLRGCGFSENDLVLVEIAERDNARQDRGLLIESCGESIARQLAGPPRRQIERGACKFERIARSRKSFDQATIAQCADQHRQEWC